MDRAIVVIFQPNILSIVGFYVRHSALLLKKSIWRYYLNDLTQKRNRSILIFTFTFMIWTNALLIIEVQWIDKNQTLRELTRKFLLIQDFLFELGMKPKLYIPSTYILYVMVIFKTKPSASDSQNSYFTLLF